MPLVPIERVVDSLKNGGIVVMECGADFVGRNEMLKKFDPLQIVHYEIAGRSRTSTIGVRRMFSGWLQGNSDGN
jgi:hypothetical protein